MQCFLGIDPGYSGASVCLYENGEVHSVIKFKETEHDVSSHFETLPKTEIFAFLEKVHSMPGQGVSSTFKFGTQFGFCKGILTALHIPYEEVAPTTWQTALNCRTKGDKNITKHKAQKLFPNEKITHATADAYLIAEYCRRLRIYE